jgi:hypothetical protein
MTATTEVRTSSTDTISIDTTPIDTYRSMRRGMMIVAAFLPVVLYVGWSWSEWPRSSMSFYYYSGARDFFVGALGAIGVFLILYRPKNPRENLLLSVAGIAALAIALSPMNEDGDCKDTPWSVHSMVHGISAVVFFGAISLVCWFFPASRRGRTRLCAVMMVSCIAVALAYKYLLGTEGKATLCSYSVIFWIELGAVWAFAYYWRLKSLDMDGTLRRWVANIPASALASFSQVTEIRNLRKADAPGKLGGKE